MAPEAREAEYEILPAGEDLGMGAMIWSPLGEGLLTGRITRTRPAAPDTRQGSDWPEPYVTDKERLYRVIDTLSAVARERGISVSQVTLAWIRQRPGVNAIVIGARNEAQLQENLGSAEVMLTPEVQGVIARHPKPRSAIVGMRPEHLADAALIDGYQRIKALTSEVKVDLVESLGADKYVYFTIVMTEATPSSGSFKFFFTIEALP